MSWEDVLEELWRVVIKESHIYSARDITKRLIQLWGTVTTEKQRKKTLHSILSYCDRKAV